MRNSPAGRRSFWIALVIAFFLAGAAGGYLLVKEFSAKKPAAPAVAGPNLPSAVQDFFTLRMLYPEGDHLRTVDKMVPGRTKQSSIAEAVVEEYFKGPGNGAPSPIPMNVKLLGIYRGADQILYVDLSDEMRRNFQGDAKAEYLVLRGLYESLIANLENLQDVKVLVEGREAETLGGHLFLKYPLKSMVSSEYAADRPLTDE